MTRYPIDQAARDRASNEVERTFFVEAGAGSGKTKTLVDRVLSLVDAGEQIEQVAAITFTERAAAELRDRLRRALRDTADDPTTGMSGEVRERRRSAAVGIDGAAIGTLHAFARRLLAEFPIEAGLPVTFSVADEVGATVRARSVWDERAEALLSDADIQLELDIVRAVGVDTTKLRELAQSLDQQWDRIDEAVQTDHGPCDVGKLRDRLCDALDELCAHIPGCKVDEDTMLTALGVVREYTQNLRQAASAVEMLSGMSADKPSLKLGGSGRNGNWDDVKAIRAHAVEVRELREQLAAEIVELALRRVLCRLAGQVLEAARRRRDSGDLTFTDLVVVARQLVTDSEHALEVRTELHDQYRRLLIDEFQDTDPLQADLAMRLTADPSDELPPAELLPLPGRLFTVGDPKQSIYRFRGADLPLYLGVGERLAGGEHATGEQLSLSANFRTVEPVVTWVNDVFSEVIRERPGSQAAYQPLQAFRGDPGLTGPAVLQLGAEPYQDKTAVSHIRAEMSVDITQAVLDAVGQGTGAAWQVERTTHEGHVRAEDARLADIAILLPRRTSLQAITDALDDAGVPYRTESSGLVYEAREIRALATTLRAIAETDNQLALVSALRSMLFGCGDDDLLHYRTAGGRWDITSAAPEGLPADHPVVESMAFLNQLVRRRHGASASQLVDELIRGRRLMELATVEVRARDMWRRLRYFSEQARAWCDGGGGSLADFVAWVDAQSEDKGKVQEAILPEHDDDAVRLLTVHASKGLEFPIVVVAGLANLKPLGEIDAAVRFTSGRMEFGAGKRARSAGWSAAEAEEGERAWDELRRLLYVACTRARDHLVVSTHRKRGKDGALEEASWEISEAAGRSSAAWTQFERPNTLSDYTHARADPSASGALEDPAEFGDALRAARLTTQRQRVITARAFAGKVARARAGHAQAYGPAPLDPDLVGGASEVVRRGRGATAFGRAVHGVLQYVDLSGGDLVGIARMQCALEAIQHEHEAVAQVVRHVLASEAVQQARSSRSWRELYVCGELDGELVEGVVDLAYETPAGLVIADYKTDALTKGEFGVSSGPYEEQVRTYARLVSSISGRPVAGLLLLHAMPDRCRTVVVAP